MIVSGDVSRRSAFRKSGVSFLFENVIGVG